MDKPIPETVVGRAHLQAVLNLSEAARCLGVAQAKNDQGAIDYWTDKTNEYEAALTAAQQQGQAVAWCALTPSGKIAYFDGSPMVMVGPVGNEHHTTPLYTAPPSAPVGVDGLPRYGFPDGNEPRPVPCADGYWTPWHLAQQPAAVDDADFEIHAGGEYFASVGGPRERAWKEAMHYVSTLRPDDGEPEVFEVTRRKVDLATQQQEPTT